MRKFRHPRPFANIGGKAPERRFSVDLRYYDTDRSALGRAYRPGAVLALRARF